MINLYKSIIYLFYVCSSNKLKLPFRIYKKSCIETAPNSKIIFNKTSSRFYFNKTWTKKNPFYSHLTMGKNSKIIINNSFRIYPNARIGLGENAVLELGSGFINTGSSITVKKHLFIGENVIIGPNCVIRDTDDHVLNNSEDTLDIIIKDNVWIGTNVTILKGVIIEKGSVIAANTLVVKSVPENSLVGGVPGKVLKSNITWS